MPDKRSVTVTVNSGLEIGSQPVAVTFEITRSEMPADITQQAIYTLTDVTLGHHGHIIGTYGSFGQTWTALANIITRTMVVWRS